MNKTPLVITALVLLLLATSCDFFRHMAGRPDSSWIKAKKARLELAQFRRDSIEQARRDSAAMAAKAAADSVHVLDSLRHAGKLRYASNVRSIPSSWLNARWGVVVGAFSSDANAAKLVSKFETAGIGCRIYKTRRGLNIVLAAPCNNVSDAISAYRRIKELPFASKECWVIVNE